MRRLAAVQPSAPRVRLARRHAAALFVVLAVLLAVPSYDGRPRLPLFEPRLTLRVDPLVAPVRRRVGRLTWQGGARLWSYDAAFGGFSALAVRGDRITLLADGGTWLSVALDRRWQPRDLTAGALPAGPRTGWEKRDRDSESLTLAPDGRAWVGFESANAIWRYAPGLGLPARGVRPWAMRKWRGNGGAESLVRLRDGRFVVISETTRWRGRTGRAVAVFRSDPVLRPGDGFDLSYLPAAGFDPVDAAQLPSGDLIVLERRWLFPLRFRHRLAIVPLAALRPGAQVRGREVARLGPPLPTENFEGIAAIREGRATMLWLTSDNDQSGWRPSYLVKYRLD